MTSTGLPKPMRPDRLMWANYCPFTGHENQFTFRTPFTRCACGSRLGPARERIFGLNALGPNFS
jgi:hypothetical protein